MLGGGRVNSWLLVGRGGCSCMVFDYWYLPILLGMLVYWEKTSMDANMQVCGSLSVSLG